MVRGLAKDEFMEKSGSSKDFFLVTKIGSVPKPAVLRLPSTPMVSLGMLVWVLLEQTW